MVTAEEIKNIIHDVEKYQHLANEYNVLTLTFGKDTSVSKMIEVDNVDEWKQFCTDVENADVNNLIKKMQPGLNMSGIINPIILQRKAHIRFYLQNK